ncbi:MAG: MGH1-like glycoside hydrolase domain-containing protein [Inquilinus sp.]|uniref:MGH1-like glycoside hydrolase domain-containing protein n=1 Tax=Inquilinus sp. TaxID=1932117 RepID=UPI003F357E20
MPSLNAEQKRLEAQRSGAEDWRRWGPYLSERAWGTVREDYSPYGEAWEHFDHDQARSRAYRWSEDGLAGLSDDRQFLCFGLALWNGRDPILKERAFGLTGNQGNHGEDVKEYYFYLDATPSHSWLRYLYKYPQAEYPYGHLVEETRRRGRGDPPFGLMDTGVFGDGRYWDVEVVHAKAGPEEIHIRITAHNRGPDAAVLHLLPTLWFRNTWSWDDSGDRPVLRLDTPSDGAAWAVEAEHPALGTYHLYGRHPADPLFTENESNAERLWGQPNPTPHVKDAFHRRVIRGEEAAVNPDRQGTKFAAWSRLEVAARDSATIELVLSDAALDAPFARGEAVFAERRAEADAFFAGLLPDAGGEEQRILRQALAGMIWSKQFFHFDVERWLKGDRLAPPSGRLRGRNSKWKHFKAGDIISMPDKWEYPWFAAWDLAYHCGALALVDVDFAKDQVEILLKETYLHPNGQIPAYEWTFDDVNPPLHAAAALKVFRAERVQRGAGDLHFLHRVFHKLLLYYAWWINRKDGDGHNVFEGGFLGLDNISVFDRSRPLPAGFRLKQADATGWMAMFALNMTVMALELATEDPDYEHIAIQTYQQFLAIANAIGGHAGMGVPLWDEEAGFFKDLIIDPDGRAHRIDVYSMVGLIPLFATEVIDRRLLANVPRFRAMLHHHKGGVFRGQSICACPDWKNDRGEHLLAIVDHAMLPRILEHLLKEDEFLSPYGIRSVSRIHAERRDLGTLPGIGQAIIEYVPGESNSGLFGGNSNWRGPIWLPVNYSLIQALEKFHRFLGDGYTVPVPCLGDRRLTLKEIATLIAERLVDLYRPAGDGQPRPAMAAQPPFHDDPHWQDLLLFYEYFHADTGQGLGAAHQTGWTGLLANLVMRRFRRDIPEFWRGRGATRKRSPGRPESVSPGPADAPAVAAAGAGSSGS